MLGKKCWSIIFTHLKIAYVLNIFFIKFHKNQYLHETIDWCTICFNMSLWVYKLIFYISVEKTYLWLFLLRNLRNQLNCTFYPYLWLLPLSMIIFAQMMFATNYTSISIFIWSLVFEKFDPKDFKLRCDPKKMLLLTKENCQDGWPEYL